MLLGGRSGPGHLLVVLTVAVCAGPAAGQEVHPPRPRVALALSGGGARGLAHVGALRALEEAGIPVDAIAANSIGAVVGSLYATGHTAAEIDAIVRGMDWAALFSGRPDRRTLPVSARRDRYGALASVSLDWKRVRLPAGLVAEHHINRFLIERLAPAGFAAGDDFDRLAIPFRAVATDLASGEPVVLARGDLARAVRASMSIPLVFPPVEWETKRLVDGYVVDNLPIGVARDFRPAVVVAVDVGSPGLEPWEYESALGVVSQVNDLLMRRRNLDYQAEADVLVRPDLGRHSSTDYSGFEELVRRGYQATRAALPQIRERLAAAGIADLAPRPAHAGARPLEGAPIREVVVRGNLRHEDALLKHTFNVPVGPGYDMKKGLRAFDKVSATGLLERSWLAFEPEGDGVRLVLQVREAPPNRGEVALGYSEWERARGAVRLVNQNTLGFGEQVELLLAGSDAESLATLGLAGDRLVVDGLGYRVRGYALTEKPRFFDEDGREVNRATFERAGLELGLRSDLRRWLEVEAGLRVGQVRTRAEAGIDLPESHDAVRVVFAGAAYDTLDSLSWPEHGDRLAAALGWSPGGLGPSLAYSRLELEGRMARGIGSRLTLQLDARAGISGGDLAVYDWYRLGGPTLVPGYPHEQLKGPQVLAAAASLRWKAFGEVRLLARAGAGNVFPQAGDIRVAGARYGFAVGAMVPTRVGPLSVELGLRDGGATLLSFAAGWD